MLSQRPSLVEGRWTWATSVKCHRRPPKPLHRKALTRRSFAEKMTALGIAAVLIGMALLSSMSPNAGDVSGNMKSALQTGQAAQVGANGWTTTSTAKAESERANDRATRSSRKARRPAAVALAGTPTRAPSAPTGRYSQVTAVAPADESPSGSMSGWASSEQPEVVDTDPGEAPSETPDTSKPPEDPETPDDETPGTSGTTTPPDNPEPTTQPTEPNPTASSS